MIKKIRRHLNDFNLIANEVDSTKNKILEILFNKFLM